VRPLRSGAGTACPAAGPLAAPTAAAPPQTHRARPAVRARAGQLHRRQGQRPRDHHQRSEFRGAPHGQPAHCHVSAAGPRVRAPTQPSPRRDSPRDDRPPDHPR